MKIITLLLMGSLAVSLAMAEGEGGYRTFTDTEGRDIRAKIVEYDSAKGKLLIEREGGKQALVAPGIFSETDRDYIRQWLAAYLSVSSQSLKVSLVKKTEKGKDEEKVYYELKLQNTSDAPLEGLSAKFRYFCKTAGYAGKEDKDWQSDKELAVATIPPGESIVLQVPAVSLKKHMEKQSQQEYSAGGGGGTVTKSVTYDVKVGEDRLIGIWLKVYSAPVEGVPFPRDVFDPKSLSGKVSWE